MNAHSPTIIIAGSGFGGLCMAARLRQSGRDDFIILEKAASLGGTWRDNRYPGAECDVASVYYSYSFYPNPTWDFKWAKQKQILSYLEQFAKDMGLTEHFRFRQAVKTAVYNDDTGRWTIETACGKTYDAQFFIPALGQLHHPSTPQFEGQDVFTGPQFHSAECPDDMDVAGRHVAVIGNAASAIQLIPEVAKEAAQVTVYQRSANWVIPKGDRPYSVFEKALARRIPSLTKLYRAAWFAVGEYGLYAMIKRRKVRSAIGVWLCKREIKRHIDDPQIRRSLVPDYPIGAKRILLSDKYYPALARGNVELVTQPIAQLTDIGIASGGGTVRAHDIIVYATGFKSHPFYSGLSVKGVNGTLLSDDWQGGAKAYHGVMTHNFPNMFMLYGPNTNSGHTSIVFKIENQVNYILQLIARAGDGSIAVKASAETRYDAEMQSRLSQTAWAKVDKSWYIHDGRIVNNWPGSALEYKRRMKTPIWDDFDVSSN